MALTLGTTIAPPTRNTSARSTSNDGRPKTSTWQTSYKLDDAEDVAMAQRIKDDYAKRNIRSGNAYVKWAVETVATNRHNVGDILDLAEAVELLTATDFKALRKANNEAIAEAVAGDDDDRDDWIAQLRDFEAKLDATERQAVVQMLESHDRIKAMFERAQLLLEKYAKSHDGDDDADDDAADDA